MAFAFFGEFDFISFADGGLILAPFVGKIVVVVVCDAFCGVLLGGLCASLCGVFLNGFDGTFSYG